jgi:biotin operon repressor
MNAPKLRDPRGWNVGLVKALVLPDGPFKLYVWLRLNARIDTGSLETSQSDLALALNKGRGTIRANLKTLEQAGVCRVKFSRDPQGRGWIQITDDYWPYEREENRKTDDPDLRSYLDQIRNILAERACIRTPFSTTDELLAGEWYAQGVTIECVGQAVLMGCARKYVSWRNGAPRTPIGCMAYFQPILAEVKEQNAPAEYWEFTRLRIERMEKLWISGKDPGRFVRPCPPWDTKIPNGGISGHGSGRDR